MGAKAEIGGLRATTDVTDPRIIKALNHPIRIEILKALDAGEASPAEVARRIGKPVNTVSYHFAQLTDLGLIELTRTAPRRGAMEHYYGPAAVEDLDAGDWSALPRLAKTGAAAGSLSAIAAEVAAAAADGFSRPEARASLARVELDREGWAQAAEELDALARRLDALARASAARRKRDPSLPTQTASIAVMQFATGGEASGDAPR